jgi:transposase-like protein
MTVREYLRKAEIDLDGDFVQQAAQLMAQAAMELEVEQQIGAARHERTPARQTQRNGYRERGWETRAGEIPLRIRSCGRAATSRSAGTRRRAEHALLAVVHKPTSRGGTARSMTCAGVADRHRQGAVSRICKDLTEWWRHSATDPWGSYPYVWLDARMSGAVNHRIVNQAVVIAIGVRKRANGRCWVSPSAPVKRRLSG